MSTTFEKAKRGDRVWSFSAGWGTILTIQNNNLYPLKVKFDDEQKGFGTYMLDGKPRSTVNQDLFWDEIKFKLPEKTHYPWEDPKLSKSRIKSITVKVSEVERAKISYILSWGRIGPFLHDAIMKAVDEQLEKILKR